MIKIAIVNKHRDDALGGSEVQCDLIAGELTERGHDVHYVAIDGEQEKYDKSYKVLKCEKTAHSILEAILQIDPQVVYWRFNKSFIDIVFPELKKSGIRIIFSASSAYDVEKFLYRKTMSLYKNFRRYFTSVRQYKAFQNADAVVVNNESYLGKLPVKNQRFIPNGMTTRCEPFQWERDYCIWVSNLKKIKRPELFIDLGAHFESIGIDFLMVGDIQQQDYELVKHSSELPSNVHCLGSKTLEEVNGILNSSLFHVHTCMAEGFPNIFIQAWLQGKPSLSYGFDPSNYIKEHSMGFDAGEDWKQFLNHFRKLFEEPDLRNEFGKNAKKFAEQKFQVKRSVSMLEELLDKVVN